MNINKLFWHSSIFEDFVFCTDQCILIKMHRCLYTINALKYSFFSLLMPFLQPVIMPPPMSDLHD